MRRVSFTLRVVSKSSQFYKYPMSSLSYVEVIQNEFDQRIQRNPAYSLRAYARGLGVDIGSLSQILAGKRKLTLKKAKKLSVSLGLTEQVEKDFILSVAKQYRATNVKRISQEVKDILNQYDKQRAVVNLSEETIPVLEDWYHFAVLELVTHPTVGGNNALIAEKLGLTVEEVNESISKLMNLGLVAETSGQYLKTDAVLNVENDELLSSKVMKRHKQIVEKVLKSVSDESIKGLNLNSITLSLDPKKMDEAKEKIDQFLKEMKDFESLGTERKVYEVAVQLLPLEINLKH